MVRLDLAQRPADIQVWLNQIAVICLSEDFQRLKDELELYYRQADPSRAGIKAFADALYAFLTEYEDTGAASFV
ncbi:MAG TPA: hypothetical protein EYP63_08150 [Desulfotomaculum sp.]|nr:hypothetical protein [Desulfotomaculum sp.]